MGAKAIITKVWRAFTSAALVEGSKVAMAIVFGFLGLCLFYIMHVYVWWGVYFEDEILKIAIWLLMAGLLYYSDYAAVDETGGSISTFSLRIFRNLILLVVLIVGDLYISYVYLNNYILISNESSHEVSQLRLSVIGDEVSGLTLSIGDKNWFYLEPQGDSELVVTGVYKNRNFVCNGGAFTQLIQTKTRVYIRDEAVTIRYQGAVNEQTCQVLK